MWDSGVVDDWVVPYRRALLGMAGVQARDGASKLKVIVRTEEQRLLADTLGFLVRVQNTISGPREGTHLCSSPNSGINERFEDLRLDFELI